MLCRQDRHVREPLTQLRGASVAADDVDERQVVDFAGHQPPDRRVRERWQAGDRDGAAALGTDETELGTTLIGTETMVRERLRVWRDAGVDTVRLYPAGETLEARLAALGRAIELVREIDGAS